jgi:hypothetical protein
LLYFILASYGLTQLLVYGRVFNRIRPRGYFWSCPMCMGFWAGVFLCVINPWTELFSFELSVINLFICGFISSGTSYVLNMIFGDSGLKLDTGGNKHV